MPNSTTTSKIEVIKDYQQFQLYFTNLNKQFKLNEFKEIFFCKYCEKSLKDPILLPCGESICHEHVDKINSIKCPSCPETHDEPVNGFTINRALREMIEIGANKFNVKLKIVEDCKNSINKLSFVSIFDVVVLFGMVISCFLFILLLN